MDDNLDIEYWNNEIIESDIGIHFKLKFDSNYEKINKIRIIHTDISDIHISLILSKIIINAYICIEQFGALEEEDILENSQHAEVERPNSEPEGHLFDLKIEFIIVDNNGVKICRKINFNDAIFQTHVNDIINLPFVQSNLPSDKEKSQPKKYFNMISKIVKTTYDKRLNIDEIVLDNTMIHEIFNDILMSINDEL
jgi:hypothetical protein